MLHLPAIVAVSVYLPCCSISIVSFCLFVCLRFLNDMIVTLLKVSEDWLYLPSLYSLFSFSFLVHSLLLVALLILLVLSFDMLLSSFLFDFISHYLSPFS